MSHRINNTSSADACTPPDAEDRIFRVIYETSAIAMAVGKPDRSVVCVNDAMCRLTGYSREELVGTPSTNIVHPDDRDLDLDAYRELLDGRRDHVTREKRYVRKDGGIIHGLMSVTLIRAGDGSPKFLVGMIQDVTAMKAAEKAIRDAEERYHLAVEAANLGVWDNDVRSGRLKFNDRFVRMLGREPGDIPPTIYSFVDLVHPDDQGWVVASVDSQTSGPDGFFDTRFRMRHADGSWRWILSRGRVVERDADGAPLRIAGTHTDITEQKEALADATTLRDKLDEARKLEAIGRLAGGVAHDFNNILTGITGYVEMGIASLPEGNPLRADLLEVKKAAGRAGALTQQLLAFSRRQAIAPRVVDLNDVLASSTQVLSRLLGEDMDLRFEPGDELWKVMLDTGQIDQVLLNLAAGARDVMPAGGRIEIATRNLTHREAMGLFRGEIEIGDYVMMSFSDNGPGMDASELAHVFEPFFTSRELSLGAGLGLATVYGIVRQNHGYIEASSSPGQGTVFRIAFPRAGLDEPEIAAAAAPVPLMRGTGTILVVEDEDIVRDLTKRVLESYGYRVVTAASGDEALEAFAEHGPAIALLLTDVVMPRMNGRELAERLRRVRPELPVVYMSGYTDDIMAQHGVIGDDTPLVHKPFSIESLLGRIQDVLGTR
ncbi:MAG: PAS domain-containing protein [Deltaproteobacteria bacterium]|nr:PAS domain-containing protein [Deltaproteobacteria bacterium]